MQNKDNRTNNGKRAPFIIFGTEAPLCGVPVIRRPKQGAIKMPPMSFASAPQTVVVKRPDDDDDDFLGLLF